MRPTTRVVMIVAAILLILVLVQSVQAAETYGYVTQWGSFGNGTGQFKSPFGVAVDTAYNVYVSDYAIDLNRIQKFNSNGGYITQWGSPGNMNGEFDGPDGIAVNSTGNVYVVDHNNDRVQVFNSSGGYIRQWSGFSNPNGIAINSSRYVYVSDANINRIKIYSPLGMYLGYWGSTGSEDGNFTLPYGVAIDTADNVYVTDYSLNRTQKFTRDGTFITKWGSPGSGDSQFINPRHIAVDTAGNVYVVDSGNNRIQKFDSSGGYLTQWGTAGSGDGQFNVPGGIAVDAGGNVYVSDIGNDRIQKFISLDVTGCRAIYLPGDYILKNDILNSNATKCINISSSNVTFDGNGYTIDGTDTSSTTGIYAYNSLKTLQNVNIRNVTLTDWTSGLIYWNVESSRIENTTANSNGLGIDIYSGTDGLKLVNNNASLNTNGFVIGSAYADIDHNTAIGNTNYGIAITSNQNNFIHENTISGVPYIGILIMTGNNRIANNTITGLGNWGGIKLSGTFTQNNSIVNNSISKFLNPIFIDSASNNTIFNNYFNNTHDGVYFDNTIYSNTWNTTKTAGTNIIGGSYFGGNYWGNTSGTGFSQTCTDANSDGICDSPYPIASGNIDNFPLTNKTAPVIPAPVAAFSGTPLSGTAPLQVSFTNLSSNNPTGWAWFFGDETYTGPWTQVNASAGWEAREGHSTVVMPDGSILLMGGLDLWGNYMNDTWRSTNNGATWTQMNASAGWSGRFAHSSVAMPDGSIVLMGGYDGSSNVTNDVWRSTDTGATWTEVNASAGWSARFGHTSVPMPNGSIVLMGGADNNYNYQNDVWRSTDNGATWTQVNASAGWARFTHSSVITPDGSIVLMGGTGSGPCVNDTWRSIDYGNTWTQVNASGGWIGRQQPSSVVLPDGSILLMGGNELSEFYNDVWRSTDTGATWTLVNTSAGWSARSGHSSVVMPDGSIVLMGGAPNGNRKNDVWRFNPTGSSVQNPSHTYTAAGIYNVSLQAYNAGGYNSTRKAGYIHVTSPVIPAPVASFTNTSPTTGTAPLSVSFIDLSLNNPTSWAWFFGDENFTAPWTQQTANAGWSARFYHSSVVMSDGSIIMMGGTDSPINILNDTWQSVDNGSTWALVNGSSGWSARTSPTSVAMPDGSIVLMGGENDIGTYYLNDTWRSTDKGATWMQRTASAGWSARKGHSSVALPDGSIVLMGGYDHVNFYNDTWRSVDNGSTWALMNGSSGWSGRDFHSSVALPDGSIVLMGGESGFSSDVKNDVWRSVNNGVTWTQVNASAGWSARLLHSSVAMPDGSIVLMGGYDHISPQKNDTWRSKDNGTTWTQLPDAGWTARNSHSSVALPDGSIVLMGGAGDIPVVYNDVWRFNPIGSSVQNPSHTYNEAGTYSVALQARNAGGYNSTRKAGYIHVTSGGTTGPVHNLNSGSNYTLIQAAIDDAAEGDTILVDSGTYWGWVNITKRLTLQGNDTSAGIPINTGTIRVLADNTIVNGFLVNDNAAYDYGIYVEANNTRILNNTVTDNRYNSIRILGANNIIANNNASYGVNGFLDESENNTFINNTAIGNSNIGFYEGGFNSTITNNTANFNYQGIRTWQGAIYYPNNSIYNNTISSNNIGIDLIADNNTFFSNIITNNSVYGIDTGTTNNNLLYNNYFNNSINAHDYPFTTSHNFFNITKIAGTNIIGGSWLGGNYWQDYTGVDTNGDGLGNTNLPHMSGMVFSGDYLPLTNNTAPALPVADFSADVVTGNVPFTVQFTDLSIEQIDPRSWSWDFGDGDFTNATEQNPVHTYQTPGIYTVNLTFTNASGSDTATIFGYLWVGSTDVAMFRGDTRHSGVYSTGGIAPTNNLLWSYLTGGPVQSSPAVANGMVYFGSDDNWIYALNATTGAEVWKFDTGDDVYSSPAVANGVLYVGSGLSPRTVFALNASTGEQLSSWDFIAGAGILSSPAPAYGAVYVGSSDSKIYALNAQTGAELWNRTTGGVVLSSPAVADEWVFVGSRDGWLHAYDARSGAELMNFPTGSNIDSSPAVADGLVYFGSDNSYLYAIGATNGTKIWEYYLNDKVFSSPAAANGNIYVGSYDGKVYAFNAISGSPLWNYPTGNAVTSSPAVADGVVYAGSQDGKVYALNASTGGKLWDYNTGGTIKSSPAVNNGVLYFGSSNRMYALGGTPAQVHNLNSGLNYTTIQGAIDDATAGDTITVDSGTYYEHVNITKQVTLIGTDTGSGLPIMDGQDENNLFILSADGIWLEGFVITNTHDGYYDNGGVSVLSNNSRILNSTFLASSLGIGAFQDNLVSGNTFSQPSGGAIGLGNSVNTTISHNLIRDKGGSGIFLSYSPNTIIEGNIITNNGLYGSDHSGIGNDESDNCIITNNTIYSNYYAGIRLYGPANNRIINNSIYSNRYGLYSGYGSSNTIIYMNYLSNTVGNANAEIWDLSILNSTESFVYEYDGSLYSNFLGNYWSSYTGTDSDGDGIGDTPYSGGSRSDYRPLIDLPTAYVLQGGGMSPVANFTANITYGEAPLAVQFTDTSTGSPTTWNWSFGDGTWFNTTVFADRNPVYVYNDEALYDISLKVSNADGENETTKTNYIAVTHLSQAAIDAVIVTEEDLLDGNSDNTPVLVNKVGIKQGDTIKLRGDKPDITVDLDTIDGTLTAIDEFPGANGDHLVTYVFVNASGQVYKTVEGMSLPADIDLVQVTGEIYDPAGENSINYPDRSIGGGIGNLPLQIACTGPDCSHKYALLISGGYNTSSNHIRYWNDISFMYQTLTKVYGYPANHITVLMSDGTNNAVDRHNGTWPNGTYRYDDSPKDLDHNGSNETNINSATYSQLTTTLNTLNTTLTASDDLFIFTTSHGGNDTVYSGVNKTILYLWGSPSYINDTQFVNKLPKNARNITIVMEQCNSGGFIDDFIGNATSQKRVIITAAKGTEPSWGNGFSNFWIGGVAMVDENANRNPLADKTPTIDGKISMLEAYNYAKANDPSAVSSLEHPLYAEKTSNTGNTQFLSTCAGTTPRSISVTTPNGGESWKRGSAYNIIWRQTLAPSEQVNITLWKGTAFNRTIAVVPASPGLYSWTVPSTQVIAGDYKVNISSITTPLVFDTSNATFSIAASGGSGYLWVNTTPVTGATIYVDGATKGVTNTKLTLANGDHKVKVTKTSSPAYYAMESNATVKTGQTAYLDFILTPVEVNDVSPYGNISVTSNIDDLEGAKGADVIIRNTSTQEIITRLTTPGVAEIMPGQYDVSATAYGYETPATQTVEVVQHESVPAHFTLTLGSNVAPLVDAGLDAAMNEDYIFSQSGSFIDPGDDTWTATVDYDDGEGPVDLALTGKDFELSHTYADNGPYTVTVTVTDDKGGVGTDTVIVSGLDSESGAPLLDTIGPKSVDEGQLLQFTISASDPDGDALTNTTSTLPEGAVFDAPTGTFTWTPGYDQAGSYPVTFTVSDGSLTDSEDVTITVGSGNRAPVLDPIGPKSVAEGQLLQFTISASDPDGDALTNTTSTLPEGAVFDAPTGTFTWTPGYNQAGSYPVTFTVSDGSLTDSEDVTITVGSGNRAPVLDPIGPQSVAEGQELQFTISASDPDGDALTNTTSTLPEGAVFDADTGTFTWTPGYDQAGSYTVTFTVSDGSLTDSEDVTITVGSGNRAPVLDPIDSKSVDEGQLLQFTISASDPDGDALTNTTSTLPEGAVFDAPTGTFTWTPGYDQAGSYTVTFTVSDGSASDFETITVTVSSTLPNVAPVVNAGADATITAGSTFTRDGSFTDPNTADTWTASVDYGEGAGTVPLIPTGQTFSLSHLYSNVGQFTVNVTVTDDKGGVGFDTANVTVTAANVPVKVLIVPKPLNIGRTGYFLAVVRLPTGYKAADVDAGSVYCEGAKALKLVRIKVFPQIFIGIFSRQGLGNYPTGTNQMYVWGLVKKNGEYVPFRGSDTVTVINKKVTTKEDIDNVMTMTDTQIFTKFNKL